MTNVERPLDDMVLNGQALLPSALLQRVQNDIPRSIPSLNDGTAKKDPIMRDLLKLTPHGVDIVTEKGPGSQRFLLSINHYSYQLQEFLFLLNDKQGLDENDRISIEANLFELTSYIPKPPSSKFDVVVNKDANSYYPNNQLSKIVIDNYQQLLKLSSTYFNMSLASHITKYMVELIYSLQYWEIYHLLYLLPELEYFLKLCDIEVTQTPFGPLVRPPSNLFKESMSQGFDYPFPYPFYNYSCHSMDPEVRKRKFERINIVPYIDITLKNIPEPTRKRKKSATPLESKTPIVKILDENTPSHVAIPTIHNPANQNIINTTITSGTNGTPSNINPIATSNVNINNNSTNTNTNNNNNASTDYSDLEGSDDEEASALRAEDDRSPTMEVGEVDEEGAKRSAQKNKSGVIHQCHLIDPSSLQPCLKIFYGKNELLRHQEFVHATKKKIYKCIYCSRNGTKVSSYPRHDSLARHIRRKHGITGKENKMAVNYAKENVEIIDDPSKMSGPTPYDNQAQISARAQAEFEAKVKAQMKALSEVPEPRVTTKLPEERHESAEDVVASTSAISSPVAPLSADKSETVSLPPTSASSLAPAPYASEFPKQPTYTGFLSFNTKQDQRPQDPPNGPGIPVRRYSRHSDAGVEPIINVENVNFNKPESSALKENFQKFRLSNSPNSASVIPSVMLPKESTSPLMKRMSYIEEKVGARLPGIGMYMNSDWDYRRQQEASVHGSPPNIHQSPKPHFQNSTSELNDRSLPPTSNSSSTSSVPLSTQPKLPTLPQLVGTPSQTRVVGLPPPSQLTVGPGPHGKAITPFQSPPQHFPTHLQEQPFTPHDKMKESEK
ncbi:hypothetical protein CAAN1_03S07140 [[Candida] anglica]|uniref:C2H2-type domain-containing protein n=1 Tax=[Candida] anglica TaxID=148631 RepID=A0ABP0EHB6_9ASCO